MSAIASQITSLTIVYSIVYSDVDQRKHQSSASLAFVWGIHRGPVNSPHKWPVTRKMSPFDDVSSIGYPLRWRWKMAALPLPVAILDDLISGSCKWGHPRWRPEAEGPPFSTSTSLGIEKSTPSPGWCHFRRRHLESKMAMAAMTSGGHDFIIIVVKWFIVHYGTLGDQTIYVRFGLREYRVSTRTIASSNYCRWYSWKASNIS